MEDAHIEDGVALTKFIYWIKNNIKSNLTELSIEKKLENFRKLNIFNKIENSPTTKLGHYFTCRFSIVKVTSSF